jgi:hypothetical protein
VGAVKWPASAEHNSSFTFRRGECGKGDSYSPIVAHAACHRAHPSSPSTPPLPLADQAAPFHADRCFVVLKACPVLTLAGGHGGAADAAPPLVPRLLRLAESRRTCRRCGGRLSTPDLPALPPLRTRRSRSSSVRSRAPSPQRWGRGSLSVALEAPQLRPWWHRSPPPPVLAPLAQAGAVAELRLEPSPTSSTPSPVLPPAAAAAAA